MAQKRRNFANKNSPSDIYGEHLSPMKQIECISEIVRPIKDKTLVVEVDSSVWMNRYAYYKWDILKRVNRMYGQEMISDIFIILTPEENAE